MQRAARYILLPGWLMALGGAGWAPWVDRAAAALVLTAPDMAEFVKFLPEVRSGALAVQRLCFLAPLFVALVTIPWVVSARSLEYPGWLRGTVLMVAATLALLLLPPVWSPPVLLADEFRLQTAGCVLCWGLVIGSRWLPRPPLAVLRIVLPPLWLAAPLLALWQMTVVQTAVSQAYGSPVTPGWGAWATLAGGSVMSLGLWFGNEHAHNRQDR